MALAPSALLIWMPAMDTDDAPACHSTDLPEENSPTSNRACIAVIHVSGMPAATSQGIDGGFAISIAVETATYSAYAPVD